MQSLGFNGGPTMNVHKQNKTGGPGNQRKARAEQARESRPFRLVCDSGQQTQASQHSGKRSSIPTRECEKYELETLDVWPWLLPATREAFDIPTWGSRALLPRLPRAAACVSKEPSPPYNVGASPSFLAGGRSWASALLSGLAAGAHACHSIQCPSTEQSQRHKQYFSVFQHRKGVSAPLRMHASRHVASAAGQDVELSFALGFPYPALSCLRLRILQPVAGI